MGDQADTLRNYVAQNPEVKQTPTEPDYRALWLGLKADLEREADGRFDDRRLNHDRTWGYHAHPLSSKRILDRMEQSETLARFKANP